GRDIGVFNVKNIDALIVDVFVSEKYRRRGICIQMLKEVLKYLNTEKNISKAHLIVRLRNHPARAAYRKAGGIEEFQAKTFRILKVPIPIHGYDL
ncbi:MAG: GNAT family N-acetyltransferase, partial [Synergistaceae bacterium]|nr:GNAT family N-acetyltransferase [Synergistaceae bacterium]